MIRGTLLPSVVVLAVIFLILPASPFPTAQAQQHKPFGTYHVEPQNKILYPRIGAPAIVTSGGTFSVYLKSDLPAEIAWGATIRSLFDRYDLTVLEAELDSAISEWRLRLQVPDPVLRGLYNLTVHASTSSLVEYSEPNSVFVVGTQYPTTIKLAVISDTHYGTVPYYRITTKILREAIDALNAIGLDLVIGAGDMTDATVDEEVFSAMRAEFLRLRVPILLAPGNNDYQSVLRGSYLWEKYLAPNSASVDFGRYHFITLDSRMGSVAEEQLKWVEQDLAATSPASFKTFVMHHPYWTETHPSLSTEIPRIIGKYGVRLVLSGHWHYDQVELSPTLSIVTTSLSTSDQLVGYRLLNLTSTGVEYTPNSLPYAKLKVAYLQHNDFSSTGGAVLIENGLETTLNFTLTFLLRNSALPLDRAYVEGGAIVRSTSTRAPSGKEALQILTTVPHGQRHIVKAYFEKDTSAPAVTIGTSMEGSKIVVTPAASDVGLGILSLQVFYSEDNKTWTEILPEIVNRVEQWTITSSAAKVYIKAEAEDAAGLRTTTYAVVEIAAPTTITTRTAQPSAPYDLYSYAGVVAAAFAVGALAIIIWRRRTVGKML